MALQNRTVEYQEVMDNMKMLKEQRATLMSESKSHHAAAKKAYDKDATYRVGTIIENEAGKSDYYSKYRDFILDIARQSAMRKLEHEQLIEQVQDSIVVLDRDIKHSRRQKDEYQSFIKKALEVAARIPAVNEALMDHYVIMSTADQSDPAGQTDLKMAGLRDEMARYQPEIVKALNAQVIHDLGFNWPFFEKNTLQPLENKINQRDKLIEELVTTSEETNLARAAERRKLSDMLADVQKRRDDLSGELATLSGQHSGRVTGLSKRVEELTEDLSNVSLKLSNKQREWSTSEAAKDRQVAALEREKVDLKDRIDLLTKGLEEANKQTHTVQTSLDSSREGIDKLQSQLTDLRGHFEEAMKLKKTEATSLNSQLEESKTALGKLQKEKKEEAELLNNQLQESKTALDTLQEKKEEQATLHAKALKESSDASDKKWEADITVRLADRKVEFEADAKARLESQEEKWQKEKEAALVECRSQHEKATRATQTQHDGQLRRCLEEQETKLKDEQRQSLDEQKRTFETERKAYTVYALVQAFERQEQLQAQMESKMQRRIDQQKEDLDAEKKREEKDFAAKGRDLRNKQLGKAKGAMVQALVHAFEQRDKLQVHLSSEMQIGLDQQRQNLEADKTTELNSLRRSTREEVETAQRQVAGKTTELNSLRQTTREEVETAQRQVAGKTTEVNSLREAHDKAVKAAGTEIEELQNSLKAAGTKNRKLTEQITALTNRAVWAEKTLITQQDDFQTLQRYIESQLTNLGLPAATNLVASVASEWMALIDAAPTMLAGVEAPLGLYDLTFVLPPVERVTLDAPDAAVSQLWLLIKSNPDALLSIRHFARRPGVSARQLNVLQDVLIKGIRLIKQGAFRQEVFRHVLVAVHALGWLYIRVGALSDGVKRRSALIQTWNDLSAWLLNNNAASDILRQVCDATFQVFEANSGASEVVLSIECEVADSLNHGNSALEGEQFIAADHTMHMALWAVGQGLTIFSRTDVRCVDYNAALCEIVLRFRDSEVEICLCRQVDHMVHVAEWAQNLVGDEYFRYIMD